MSGIVENGYLSYCCMQKLWEQLEQKKINPSETVDILNDQLKNLDPNSDGYVEEMQAITNVIHTLTNDKIMLDRETYNKMTAYFQQIFYLNNFKPTMRTVSTQEKNI